jgi:serine phosphatase RsbU (regulator of sigma subunit)
MAPYFAFWGISASSLLWMMIINHALMHEKTLDLAKFYREVFFWIIFFMVLVAPSYLIMRLGRTEITAGNPIPIEGIAVMIFLYLFLSYRFLKPVLQKFITRSDAKFEAAANEFFEKIAQVTSEEKGESFWDLFLENSILPLEIKFSIDAASLYMVTAEGTYELGYSFGTKLNPGEITPGNDMYKCLQEYGRLVHVSFFYVDEKLEKFMSVREIMERAGIAVMIPFFSQERMLIGTLLLGTHMGGMYYPQELLGFFETYRIQLELSMGNALMLEEVKRLQIKEHENLVIRSIKKRLVPAELPTINGIRISSLFVDNSDMGGDYLDTVVLGKNSVGLFMCDAADAGVESGILLLELYSVLHNQPEKMDTPDKMLNAMNWVIATSRYTTRYVPALYCTYDNNTREISITGAAFNPLVLYNIKKDEFSEFDIKGIPLGLEKNYSYEMKKIKIGGEVVGFIYSDGVTAAVNKNGLVYSTGRIKDIIRLNKEDTPAILARKIYKDFIAFTEGVEMKTDASLLIFKISQ